VPKIKITSIQCHKPEESEDHPFQPGDELRLDVKVDDDRFFTLAVWKGVEFVTGKKRWINREWEFVRQIEIRLVELDGYTSDESLGIHSVEASSTEDRGAMKFTELGADYTIEYLLTH
jgi:hypothetical protein